MEKKKIDPKELQEKLHARLGPSGWADKLRGFTLSKDFIEIIEYLINETEEGKRFVPSLKYLFRAFEECSYNDTRVVIIGQDPYPQIGVPDGLAFSCSLTQKAQPSLEYISKEINKTVYPDREDYSIIDLLPWAKQGVLLLNSALTVLNRQPGTHYLLWRPFIVYFIDIMIWNQDKQDVVWVFMGNKAKEYMDIIPDNFHKLNCIHPAAAAHNKAERWDSGDIFNLINKKIKGDKIIW
jgi:uracil-DNA glycosylase